MSDPPPTPPQIAIVTVLFNSEPVLPAFLSALHAQDRDDFVVCAVDSASSDRSREIYRSGARPDWQLIECSENVGFARGTNLGLRWGLDQDIPWLLLLNNDTTFPEDFLTRLLGHAHVETAPVIVPLIEAAEPAGTVWCAGGRVRRREGYLSGHAYEGRPVQEVPDDLASTDFACGCAVLIAASALRKVGLLDETFFVYAEDVDLSLRLHQANIPIQLDPSARVIHHVSSLTGGGESAFTQFWQARNWVLLIRKHSPNVIARWYFYAFIAAWQTARVAIGIDSWRVAQRRIRGYCSGARIRLS